MDRRNFVRLVAAGTGATLITPRMVLADAGGQSMAGGVYYTADAPGRWNGKVAGHLPTIECEESYNGCTVKVTTAHGMNGYDHYIVKHVLLDQHFDFLQERLFNPYEDMTPESTFTLPSYKGRLYALSVCNKHDTWLNMIKV